MNTPSPFNTAHFITRIFQSGIMIGFLLLPGCQKEETKLKPTVVTSPVSNISATAASAGGNVSSDGGATVTARGIVWGTATGPTTSLSTKTTDGTGSGNFTSSMSGLTASTNYFVRAYATNSVGTSYGEEISFVAISNLPTITTSSIVNITTQSATGGGNISNDAGSPVTARGIVWSTSTAPTISLLTKTNNGSGTGAFTSSIGGLSIATKYYVRAYATNSNGTSYGNELNFTTLANLSSLVTTIATNITSVSATSGGTISADGGAPVTSRGIVWDTNTNPTIVLTTKTTDGAVGVGNFISNLSGLAASTKYYVRAYATNSTGTSYGDEITFTTTSLLSHDFNKTQIPVGGNCFADNGATITADGLTTWTSTATIGKTFIRLSQAGTLKVSLKINATGGTNTIQVTILNRTKQLTITGNSETEIYIDQFDVPGEGYISMDVKGISKTSSAFGILSNFYVSGTAVTNTMTFVPNNDNNLFYWGRRGTALSLFQDITGIGNIEWFYTELKVPSNYDAVGSYYMTNGFGEGYFGIQVKSPTERWVLFSVWSPNTTNDPNLIPPEDRVILVRKGANVVTGTFGNEGAGGQSYLVYNWKAENTYKFLVQGKPIANNFTQYTAWFFAPEDNTWYLIASWNRPKTSTYLKSLYSFIENFLPETGTTTRMAYYGNQWVKPDGGNWTELIKGTVTGSPENQYRKDYAGGLVNGSYYLKISGFFNAYTALNQPYQRTALNIPPSVNLNTLP